MSSFTFNIITDIFLFKCTILLHISLFLSVLCSFFTFFYASFGLIIFITHFLKVYLMWTIFKVFFIEFVTIFFCFMLCYFGWEACRILVPQPGIGLASSAVEGEVLTTRLPGKSLCHSFKKISFSLQIMYTSSILLGSYSRIRACILYS